MSACKHPRLGTSFDIAEERRNICMCSIKVYTGSICSINSIFFVSVNLYGTLVHMENIVQVDFERHGV
jgi:hypothetical protein